MTAGLTSEQLEFLASRQHQQRTASALHSGGSINDSFWPRFETVEACQHEDRARAAALREFDDDALLENSNDDSDWLLERSADELATLLENIADPDRKLPAPPCLASSVYMRNRRIGVLGATLELVAAHPDLDRAWFTARHPALQFRADGRGSWATAEALTRLHELLQVSGASSATGFLITFLHGHLDPEREQFHLQYRGLVLGNKLEALRRPTHHPSLRPAHLGLAVTIHPITDLRQQLTRMMPNYLRERQAAALGNSPTINRMREPYHSMYLMWLARRRLADLIVVDGAFYWDGGLELRECYAENEAGALGSSASSNVPQLVVAATDQPPPGHANGAQQRQAKPRDVHRNQSARKSHRRVMAVFPNRTETLKRRDDFGPGV
jgi:hypothetical protein